MSFHQEFYSVNEEYEFRFIIFQLIHKLIFFLLFSSGILQSKSRDGEHDETPTRGKTHLSNVQCF